MTEAETETADPNTCEYKGMTVTYKRCEVLTDDYGNSALFVYFDFTNNSEDTESFYNSEFVSDFCDFLKQYLLWLKDLAENNRQLDLFKLDCGSKPFNIINGIEPSRVASLLSDYSLYFSYLNGTSITSGISDNDKFMEMHYLATEKITKDKIKLQ